jgi:hypothetical protein
MEDPMTPFLPEKIIRPDLSRREFLTSAVSLSAAASVGSLASAGTMPPVAMAPQAAAASAGTQDLPSGGKPIKLFCCDLNWVRLDQPVRGTSPAAPQDWAFINPNDHFEWHNTF